MRSRAPKPERIAEEHAEAHVGLKFDKSPGTGWYYVIAIEPKSPAETCGRIKLMVALFLPPILKQAFLFLFMLQWRLCPPSHRPFYSILCICFAAGRTHYDQ
jgi:hypothetical protein